MIGVIRLPTAGKQEFNLIKLIWDLDGTLVDSMPTIAAALNSTAKHFNKPEWSDDKIQQMIGPELGLILKGMLGIDSAEQINEAKTVYRSFYSQTMTKSPVFAGLTEVLTQFKQTGVTLYVATAKYQAYAQQILDANGLAGLFTGIYGSEEDGHLGDKTELLGHLLSEEDINPAQCVMIGDTKFDIIAGRNQNMTTVAVSWGYGDQSELKEAGAHFFADSVDELPELIKTAMSCAC